MTVETSSIESAAARANELYWGSDASVNELAERLDLSKGALYGMIRPLGARVACPDCGDEMEYANRTAREKGFLNCASCGMEEEEELIRVDAGQRSLDLPGVSAIGGRAQGRTLAAAALLGAAAGFALGRLLGRD